MGTSVKTKSKLNRFHAEKITTELGKFDSTAEYNRYLELLEQEKQGLIIGLDRQTKFKWDLYALPAGNSEKVKIGSRSYSADFTYITKAGEMIFEDLKGWANPEFLQKKKIVEKLFGIKILIVDAKKYRKKAVKNEQH